MDGADDRNNSDRAGDSSHTPAIDHCLQCDREPWDRGRAEAPLRDARPQRRHRALVATRAATDHLEEHGAEDAEDPDGGGREGHRSRGTDPRLRGGRKNGYRSEAVTRRWLRELLRWVFRGLRACLTSGGSRPGDPGRPEPHLGWLHRRTHVPHDHRVRTEAPGDRADRERGQGREGDPGRGRGRARGPRLASSEMSHREPPSLAAIARALGAEAPPDAAEIVPTGVSYDSRRVRPGHLFCCVRGTVTDGHLFAADAVAAGASAVLVEKRLDLGVPEVIVPDTRIGAALAAAEFFARPAEKLLMLGITGTNGKTTTSYLLESILRAEGRRPGLIGTIETHVGDEIRPGVRTTPESVDLQELLAEMVAAGVEGVAMEVTSHALALHRVEGIRYAAAGFTNLSQDHLDFHSGMDDYFEAKRALFTPERSEKGAVNVDDPYGARLFADAAIPCLGYGIDGSADVAATDIVMEPTESRFTIRTPKGEVAIGTGLVGSFNVYNCLAAAAVALQAGLGLDAIEEGLNAPVTVPGRFESID